MLRVLTVFPTDAWVSSPVTTSSISATFRSEVFLACVKYNLPLSTVSLPLASSLTPGRPVSAMALLAGFEFCWALASQVANAANARAVANETRNLLRFITPHSSQTFEVRQDRES